MIRKRYLRGWFAYDLVTSLPLDLLALVTGPHYIGFLRIPRILKATRLLEYAHMTEQRLQLNPSIFRIIKLFGFFLLFAHTTGCLWYAIPDIIEHHSNWRTAYKIRKSFG